MTCVGEVTSPDAAANLRLNSPPLALLMTHGKSIESDVVSLMLLLVVLGGCWSCLRLLGGLSIQLPPLPPSTGALVRMDKVTVVVGL